MWKVLGPKHALSPFSSPRAGDKVRQGEQLATLLHNAVGFRIVPL